MAIDDTGCFATLAAQPAPNVEPLGLVVQINDAAFDGVALAAIDRWNAKRMAAVPPA